MQILNGTGWIGSISLTQVENLEEMFAELKETGWVIPDWLIALRKNVEDRIPKLTETVELPVQE